MSLKNNIPGKISPQSCHTGWEIHSASPVVTFLQADQGCQIFWYNIPKWENIYTKLHQNIPNGGKLHQIDLRLHKWP
jgi:hypothetical protein